MLLPYHVSDVLLRLLLTTELESGAHIGQTNSHEGLKDKSKKTNRQIKSIQCLEPSFMVFTCTFQCFRKPALGS